MNLPRGRPILALGVSLALHGLIAGVALGLAVWKGFSFKSPIEIEIKTEPPRALPLGPPPQAVAPPPETPAPTPSRPRRRPLPPTGTVAVSREPDAGVRPDAGPDASVDAVADAMPDARPTPGPAVSPDAGVPPPDLRAAGPEGSRLTALLRLDRLRDSPEYIPMVDALLKLLPDRRRLVTGSALDLYKDFDALLIATPNPLDDAVTFLAVRHHLTPERLQAELSKAASAGGRPIVWQMQGQARVGLRKIPDLGDQPSDLIRHLSRDDRLFVLPAPDLAVIAPPVYAPLLLPGADPGGDASVGASEHQNLAARLSAESDAIAVDAVFRLTANALFSQRKAGNLAGANPLVAPIAGLDPPQILDLSLGVAPAPWVTIVAEFETAAAAAAWAAELPRIRQRFIGNALLALAGLTQVLANIEVVAPGPDGKTVIVRTHATRQQVERILGLVMNLVRSR